MLTMCHAQRLQATPTRTKHVDGLVDPAHRPRAGMETGANERSHVGLLLGEHGVAPYVPARPKARSFNMT